MEKYKFKLRISILFFRVLNSRINHTDCLLFKPINTTQNVEPKFGLMARI